MMGNRNLSFLQDISDDDKRLLTGFLEWTELADEKYITKYSAFLDERQCRLCEKVMASVKYENYLLWGGYESAGRKMLCVYPQYSDDNIRDTFPMSAVTFRYRIEDKPGHRDFLGSLMGLGITRNCIGDILVGDGSTVVFVRDTVVSEVLGVGRIGRIGVRTECGFDESAVKEPEFREISGTVASMRLDSVLSVALRISREKAAALIRGGTVEVYYVKADQPGKKLEAGDIISARGYGKFLLKSVDGVSHKDRLHITICKYI